MSQSLLPDPYSLAREVRRLRDEIESLKQRFIEADGSDAVLDEASPSGSFLLAESDDAFPMARVLGEGPGIDLVDEGEGGSLYVGVGGDKILLYDSNGDPAEEYDADASGLTAALAAASSGDVVKLPAGEITPSNTLYDPDTEVSSGSFNVTSSATVEITGLTVGALYCIEGTGGPWYYTAGTTDWAYTISISDDGVDFDDIGRQSLGEMISLPDWGVFIEYTADNNNVRVYFVAGATSIYAKIKDSDYPDNHGTIGWKLSSGKTNFSFTIPAGVEVVGLGKNSILDGFVVNNGILTNLQVTGEVRGTGQNRLVYNAAKELLSTPILSTVATGTAPLEIASTTQVQNLNVDLLDGKHASEFALADHTHVEHVHISHESHSAECNGSATVFTCENYYLSHTLLVWLNGLLQTLGTDYTEGLNNLTVILTTAPLTGDTLTFAYIQGAASSYVGPYDNLIGTETVIKVQIHDHTTGSDGSLTPAQIVAAYAAAGYGALMISDHDIYSVQPAGITTAISGSELSPNTAHILSINNSYDRNTETDEQTILDGIDTANGLAVIAHPNWLVGASYADLAALTKYLGIEIHNGYCVSGAGQDPVTYPGFAVALWDNLLTNVRQNIWGFAHDDFHTGSYNTGYDIGRLRVFAASNSLANIIAALENGNFVSDVSNEGVTPGLPAVTKEGVSVTCTGATAIRFIGSGGELLEEDSGETGSYTFVGDEVYVRVEAVGDFTEGFGSAIDTDNLWGVQAGTWGVSGGLLRQTATDSGPQLILLKKHINGDIDATVKICINGTDGQAGILFNFLNTDNAYYLHLKATAPDEGMILWKWVGGTGTAIQKSAQTINTGTWYTMRLQYTASTGAIKARYWESSGSEPGTWHIESTDTALAVGGAIGLRCRYANDFDDLYVNGFKTYYQPIPVG